jgi:hypothetical protein
LREAKKVEDVGEKRPTGQTRRDDFMRALQRDVPGVLSERANASLHSLLMDTDRQAESWFADLVGDGGPVCPDPAQTGGRVVRAGW